MLFSPSRLLVRLWVLCTWLLPIGMILLPGLFLPGGIVLGYNTKYGVCTQKSSHKHISIYNGINVPTFFVPLFVTIVCYMAIFVQHRRDANRMVRCSSSDTGSDSNIRLSSINSISKPNQQMTSVRIKHTMMFKLRRRQIQITKNMLCVVSVFVLCILPYVIVAQKVVSGNAVVRLVPYAGALVYLNSAVNPFIYTRHPNFRQVFRLVLKCKWSDIPEPSTVLKLFMNNRL